MKISRLNTTHTILKADQVCYDKEGKVRRYTKYQQRKKNKLPIGVAVEDSIDGIVKVWIYYKHWEINK